MKKYEDERIHFLYPEDFKITRAKKKYGSYTLSKSKSTFYVSIELIPKDTVRSVRNVIQSQPPDDLGDRTKVEYFDSVRIGEIQGIGHHALAYDQSHKLWGEIYRYLFPIQTGGIYIEISAREAFSRDLFKELLESIKVKE